MSKAFREAFPTLKLEEELDDLDELEDMFPDDFCGV